ncbi:MULTISPECIES: hypothetical protein [unclassified Streptomyces]|uniref:hypothetical protein n=1 Tax=unclassified Streptomyces TaxID=2593676 RepID=UPI0033C0771D
MTRASVGVVLAGAAAAGTLIAGAGTATAATYRNDLVRTLDTGVSANNWTECDRFKYEGNLELDRHHPRDPQEYYYCAPGVFSNGVQRVNLWLRHRA